MEEVNRSFGVRSLIWDVGKHLGRVVYPYEIGMGGMESVRGITAIEIKLRFLMQK